AIALRAAGFSLFIGASGGFSPPFFELRFQISLLFMDRKSLFKASGFERPAIGARFGGALPRPAC
ncbi:MAG TPA: hypothetical protein DC001_01550, partial [Clostridiales bacterium]|nr:hypothetical protein [Clostridiales bacterium]